MNKRLISVLLFALVVSAGASFLLYRLVVAEVANSAKPSGVKLVVAEHNLATGALIKDVDVKLVDWNGPVPEGAFTKTSDVIDRGVIDPIYSDEPLVESRLAARGAGAGLAATIPQGMRAVAVRVNDVVGVAGFVTPGMRVDVLISGNPPGRSTQEVGTLTKTLLQDIQVLSAGQDIQKNAEGKPVSVPVVNLLVTPEQAEILSLASNETRIQLVLRNPTDTKPVQTPGTALAYLFANTNRKMPEPKPRARRRVVSRKTVTLPVAPRVTAAPAPPEKVAITVEIIQGSKKSEAKFMEDKESKAIPAKPEGSEP